MTVILLCALITAIITAYLVHPVMTGKGKDTKRGLGIAFIIAVFAIGLYALLGSPDARSYAALFDTDSLRAAQRALTGQELLYMQALTEDPENIELMAALAAVRIQAGRLDDAGAILERARTLAPDNAEIKALIKTLERSR